MAMAKLSAYNMTVAAISFRSVAVSVYVCAPVCECLIHSFMRGQEEEDEDEEEEEKPLLHRSPAATAPRNAHRSPVPLCRADGEYWRQEVRVYGTPTSPRRPPRSRALPPPTTRPKCT